MSINDPLSDLIARINNAQMRKKPKITTPGSRLRVSVQLIDATGAPFDFVAASTFRTTLRSKDSAGN